jgi:hypothetical protein
VYLDGTRIHPCMPFRARGLGSTGGRDAHLMRVHVHVHVRVRVRVRVHVHVHVHVRVRVHVQSAYH